DGPHRCLSARHPGRPAVAVPYVLPRPPPRDHADQPATRTPPRGSRGAGRARPTIRRGQPGLLGRRAGLGPRLHARREVHDTALPDEGRGAYGLHRADAVVRPRRGVLPAEGPPHLAATGGPGASPALAVRRVRTPDRR